MQIHIAHAVIRFGGQPLMSELLTATPEPAPAAASITPPPIGTYWAGQGGIYAGVMRGRDGQADYHLIVAQEEGTSLPWGEYGREVAGAASEWDGEANTAALTEDTDGEHHAADHAASLIVDGHADFYLPARRELRLAWTNCPELFTEGWHWSSTQFSAHGAWCQSASNGSQLADGKLYAGRVRAVRRFKAHPLTT